MCMAQDRRGDIWLGGWPDGLSRFDGRDFESFSGEGKPGGTAVFEIIEDTFFDPGKIGAVNYDQDDSVPHDLTTIVNGMQVNHNIILPWKFLLIHKE